MSSQWKLVPVEPTETMVINGFESVPDECFTDEEVWEQYQAMSGCQQAAFRAKLCWAAMLASAPAAPQAELDPAVAERDATPKPDPVLCKFYDVDDWASLVRELVDHVAQLQDSAKRNVKPWEDTFPPTLLPAYIERVNAENAAAQPQGKPTAKSKPVAKLHAERLTGKDGEYGITVEDSQWFNTCRLTGGEFYLYAEQPAPVAVVLDEKDEFVTWVRREWPQAPLSNVRDLLPKDDPRYGEYCDEALQRAWVGWQARAAVIAKS
ncbi:hypothetical protein [Pseudomonas orientalis]|uniref:hypothetical protein n=1 Tax=Pseudomonas orientalis TaxID=76758 RepID=UPI000F6BD398|nr:hypothetical protein [Pseudomonas orientalis]AZE90271.1 Eaa protein [Pseudomonas orientalis]